MAEIDQLLPDRRVGQRVVKSPRSAWRRHPSACPSAPTAPCQNGKCSPGTPASSMVGTSGAANHRFVDSTANALMLPARYCGSVCPASGHDRSICPGQHVLHHRRDARDTGSAETAVPVLCWKSSRHMCVPPPSPEVPAAPRFGLAFSQAISSFISFAGRSAAADDPERPDRQQRERLENHRGC